MTKNILEYDVVIIGSGAGGGTVAKELAPLCEKGFKVALLEWGGRFQAKDNSRQELEMAKKYYFDYGGFQNTTKDITFAFAKAIGGSTTVYTGTSLTAPSEVFEKWGIPGIDHQDMKPRYEKYMLENNVHLNSLDELNENNLLFKKGCEELNWRVKQFPVNTKNCQGLGTCNMGCAILAKQGTHQVQIPKAQKLGVDVYPFCRALKIEGHDVLCEILAPEHGLEASPLGEGYYRFRAKRIVVCAGVVHSPALLMKSFGKKFLPAIGRYFTCHPALILAADHGRSIQNIEGHPKSFYCDEFVTREKFLLETCMYFPFTLAKNLVGLGNDIDELMGDFSHIQLILALIMDEARFENRISIDSKGNPKIHYYIREKEIEAFVRSIRASTKIFFAAGAKRVHAPAMDRFFIYPEEEKEIDKLILPEHFKLGKVSIAAAHLMGGCRMGVDLKTSVTNAWGKIHGFEHIYVADASLFPAPSEVNPYLTIMALADRVAQGIKEELGA